MATCPMTRTKSGALSYLMSDNPRYAEMFDVNTQTANTGVDMDRDYTGDMNRLRDKAAVQAGSLRSLLGVPEMEFSPVKREKYTFFSYRACIKASPSLVPSCQVPNSLSSAVVPSA